MTDTALVWTSIDAFKALAADISRHAPPASPSAARHTAALLDTFLPVAAALNDVGSEGGPSLPLIQRELLPYLLLARTTERAYTKPRGYGGDYLTIDLIYRNEPCGVGRVGAAIDALFLALPAARAVRHRRRLVADEIRAELARRPEGVVRVMSIGSGPAREVRDVFANADARRRLQVTLVDMDADALASAQASLAETCPVHAVTLLERNVVKLALRRARAAVPAQDLIYSIGLLDYLPDALAVPFLDLVHTWLAPGGRAVIGNFHPRNPTRGLLDHLLDWPLIHRTDEDMHRLFTQSAFGSSCRRIVYEPEGINLFAEGVKAPG